MNCEFLRMRTKGYGPAPKSIERDLRIVYHYHPLFPPRKEHTPYRKLASGGVRGGHDRALKPPD